MVTPAAQPQLVLLHAGEGADTKYVLQLVVPCKEVGMSVLTAEGNVQLFGVCIQSWSLTQEQLETAYATQRAGSVARPD